MEFQEYDFILNLGCKIRNILYSTEDYSKVNWVDNSIEEYNENQNFSSTTLNNLLNFLNDYHELKEDFSKVFFDDECPQNRQILLETIFFEDNNEKFEEEEFVNKDDIFCVEEEIEEENILTPGKMLKKQEKMIKTLSETFYISDDVAFLLLKRNYWNYDRTMLLLTENKKEALKSIGVSVEKGNQPLTLRKVIGTFVCDVCYDEYDYGLSLVCGHCFCENCWKDHIKYQIEQGIKTIKCMNDSCKQEVMLNDVYKYCGQEIGNNFKNFLLEDQVNKDSRLVPCTAPGCNQVLTIQSVGPCFVATCTCGKKICWKCHKDSHAPLLCSQIKKWENEIQYWKDMAQKQKLWEIREKKLISYRLKNIQNSKQEKEKTFINLIEKYKEMDKKEENEISYLTKELKKHSKDKNYSSELLQMEKDKLSELELQYKKNQKNRNEELHFLSDELKLLQNVNKDPNHASFYFREIQFSTELHDFSKLQHTSEEWLEIATKKCPKCKSPISKDGGCNYIKCYNCGYEFCWICCQNWKTHGDHFVCNKYDQELKVDDNFEIPDIVESDIDIEDNTNYPPPINIDKYMRFIHYFKRYTNHLQSQLLEKKNREMLLQTTILKFRMLSEKLAKEFLESVFKVIDEARSILIWSYPMAYMMEVDSKELKMFEIHQGFLEMSIEQLEGMIERFDNYTIENLEHLRNSSSKYINIILKEADDYHYEH